MRWLIALLLTPLVAVFPVGAQMGGADLAAAANGGKVVSATSEDAPEWGAANLIDGVKGRRGWSSVLQTGAPPQEVIVDLAGDEPVVIDRVVINVETGPEMLYGRFWAKDVAILVSATDAAPQSFQPVATATLEKNGKDQTIPLNPVPARFVKLRVNSVQGGAQGTHVEVGEMEVYAAGVGAASPVGPPVTPTVTPVTPVTPTVTPVTPVTPTTTETTPVTPATYPGPEANLAAQAAGGKVFATSFRDDYYTPDLLNDGLTGAEELDSYAWCSETEPVYPQDLTVEFKNRELHCVSRVVVNSNTGEVAVFGDRWPRDVEIYCSATGTEDGDFQKVATATLKKIQENQVIDFPPALARFVRVRILSNYGHPKYVEVAEVEAWGAAAPATTTAPPVTGPTTTVTPTATGTTPAVGETTPPTTAVGPTMPIAIPKVEAGQQQDLDSLIAELEQVLEKLKALRTQGG